MAKLYFGHGGRSFRFKKSMQGRWAWDKETQEKHNAKKAKKKEVK